MNFFWKKISLILLPASLMMASCDSGTGEKMENEADSLAANIEEGIDDLGKVDAESFVKNAIEQNNEELKLIAEGKANATSSEVKQLANTMESDHKALGDKMMAYATAHNISVDADDMQTDDEMVSGDKGNDWDKNWVEKVIDMHEKAIDDFENAQEDIEDAELKGMVTDALPTLRSHLEKAQAINNNMK